jgi:hypothetical protein
VNTGEKISYLFILGIVEVKVRCIIQVVIEVGDVTDHYLEGVGEHFAK